MKVTIVKADLIAKVAEVTSTPASKTKEIVEALFSEIEESLKDGKTIMVKGFGSFYWQQQKAKVGRDLKSNTPIQIPERLVMKFKSYMDESK